MPNKYIISVFVQSLSNLTKLSEDFVDYVHDSGRCKSQGLQCQWLYTCQMYNLMKNGITNHTTGTGSDGGTLYSTCC